MMETLRDVKEWAVWRHEEGKDKNLGVSNIQMLFIAMDLDEII